MKPLLSIAVFIAVLTLSDPRLSMPAAVAQGTATPSNQMRPAGVEGGRVVGIVNFQGASVQAVVDYYARELAKRSVISPPNLAGAIFFRSQTDLTVDDAMHALETALALEANIAIVPMGDKFLKVVQLNAAKQEGVPFNSQGRDLPMADRLVTQIIQPRYVEVADIDAAIRPYMHAYGQLMQLPKSNSLLITETGNNINLMLEIIKAIDVPSPLRMETKVYVLAHAKAGEIAQRLQTIIQATQQMGLGAAAAGGQPQQPVRAVPVIRPPTPGMPPAAGGSAAPPEDTLIEGKVIITPDERTNKILVLSRPSNFAFFDKIIVEFDVRIEPDLIIKVIPLNYDTAENVASLVNAVISGGSVSTSTRRTGSTTAGGRGGATLPAPTPVAAGAGAGAAATEGFLQYSEGVRILPDQRTNSLLVMATKEDMARIEALIRSVDVAVAQVQIEVIIAEVTLNNELDVGVDLFKRLFDSGAVSQGGGSSTDGNTPIQLPSASAVASGLATNALTAAALASGGGLTYFATFRNLKLDAVIHALATTSKGKVLSTPVIQTMDNQEAKILVGESVPVPVSQVSSLVSGGGTLSTGQLNSNIDYKDAAIDLTVTPRINPDGYVRMEIEQKVNDFGAPVQINGGNVPTITKREAKSLVAVQDGSTIALGGLIKETKTVTEKKVPILGDIPFFGQIFKSKATNKVRNELIIFIRPTVLRTDAQAFAEARRRANLLSSSGELELERQLRRDTTNAPSSTSTNLVPQPLNQPAGDRTSLETERRAAKVQALQEQTAPSN